jgi:hypothetical protein
MRAARQFLLIVPFLFCVSISLAAQEHSTNGLTGHLTATVNGGVSQEGFTFGVSFFNSVYPLDPVPTAGTQLGWGTWLVPDNLTFTSPLCPVGTHARDNWEKERGSTYYRDVYQTIEGGIGQWTSTHFPASIPKFRVNGTPDCYDTQIGATGWTFGGWETLPGGKLGLAQLSNRLLLPPDGLPFIDVTSNAMFGYGWIALPLIPAHTSLLGAPTGDQSWTLFFHAGNFKGPVAFFVPDAWSAISASYPTDHGRGHDARPGFVGGVAMEIASTPMFTSQDKNGVRYRRVPKLTFDVDAAGRAVLQQDVKFYSKQAMWDIFATWIENGTVTTQIDEAGIFTPPIQGSTAPITLGGDTITFDPSFYTGAIKTSAGTDAFGMQWSSQMEPGVFPEYFKEENGTWKPIAAGQVPSETALATQTFAPAPRQLVPPLDVSSASPWASDKWSAGPFTVSLSDSSSVDYVWYKFVDQPAIARLGLSDDVRQRLQTFVESLHEHSGLDGITIPPPSAGSLASIDTAQFVTPPPGLEKGYVPIVIRQYKPATISAEERAALEAFYHSTNGDGWLKSMNWLSGPIDTWFGITIENDHVVAIDLPSNNLTGTLPVELGNLKGLRRVELSQNHISGPIPSEIGQLSELTFFSAYNNELSGSIPSEVGNLQKLELLQLGSNNLAGALPSSFGRSTALFYLLLAGNNLGGTLPSEIGSIGQLKILELNDNEFSGPLPSSLAKLGSVEAFRFDQTGICIPVDAALQGWLASIPTLASTNLTCPAGTVKISAFVKAKGVDSAGVRYLDLEFRNTGTSYARNTTVGAITFKTLAGSGAVTLASPLPIVLDTIASGGSKIVRLSLNVPSTVTRFSITETGQFTDVMGKTFKFSISQSVFP